MARRQDHLWIDRSHLEKEFDGVHAWLDRFCRSQGGAHRRELHHREGVEEIRYMWGDEAARSAELHVLLDIGHIPTKQQWNDKTMDMLGRRKSYLQRFGFHAEDCAFTMAYSVFFPCRTCGTETEQRLFDVPLGRFYCSRCKGVNHFPEYRIQAPVG